MEEEIQEEKLLVPEETYISCGVEIGTQQKTAHMERFIERVRNDGLYIIDIKKTDERSSDTKSVYLRAILKALATVDQLSIANNA